MAFGSKQKYEYLRITENIRASLFPVNRDDFSVYSGSDKKKAQHEIFAICSLIKCSYRSSPIMANPISQFN